METVKGLSDLRLGVYTAEVSVLYEKGPSADIRTLFEVALIRYIEPQVMRLATTTKKSHAAG